MCTSQHPFVELSAYGEPGAVQSSDEIHAQDNTGEGGKHIESQERCISLPIQVSHWDLLLAGGKKKKRNLFHSKAFEQTSLHEISF